MDDGGDGDGDGDDDSDVDGNDEYATVAIDITGL